MISCVLHEKIIPTRFRVGIFVYLLVKLTFGSHVELSSAPVWMSFLHVVVNFSESVLCFEPFFSCHNRNLLFFCVCVNFIIFTIKPEDCASS